MARNLAVLVRLHRWRLDEQRRQLAVVLRGIETLESRLSELERDIVREQNLTREADEDGDAAARSADEPK